MGRTIDADALRERIYHESFETDSDMQKWDSGCWIRYKLFEKCLNEQPTVQPQRKTGKWIRHKDWSSEGYCEYTCSKCDMGVDVMYDYCPRCGADMRGDGMSDLIDRQAAIEAIEEYADRLQMVDWKENPGVPYKAHALNWCINTIRDLPPQSRTGFHAVRGCRELKKIPSLCHGWG